MKSKTKRMDEIRQILETYHACGYYKRTARRLQVSKNTVKGYVQRAEAIYGTVAQALAVEDEALQEALCQPAAKARPFREQAFDAQLEHWCAELRKVGVTRYLLWQEYRRSHPDGYGYTQFCERLRRHLQAKGLSMALSHKPGHAVYLDFAGMVCPPIIRTFYRPVIE